MIYDQPSPEEQRRYFAQSIEQQIVHRTLETALHLMLPHVLKRGEFDQVDPETFAREVTAEALELTIASPQYINAQGPRIVKIAETIAAENLERVVRR